MKLWKPFTERNSNSFKQITRLDLIDRVLVKSAAIRDVFWTAGLQQDRKRYWLQTILHLALVNQLQTPQTNRNNKEKISNRSSFWIHYKNQSIKENKIWDNRWTERFTSWSVTWSLHDKNYYLLDVKSNITYHVYSLVNINNWICSSFYIVCWSN